VKTKYSLSCWNLEVCLTTLYFAEQFWLVTEMQYIAIVVLSSTVRSTFLSTIINVVLELSEIVYRMNEATIP